MMRNYIPVRKDRVWSFVWVWMPILWVAVWSWCSLHPLLSCSGTEACLVPLVLSASWSTWPYVDRTSVCVCVSSLNNSGSWQESCVWECVLSWRWHVQGKNRGWWFSKVQGESYGSILEPVGQHWASSFRASVLVAALLCSGVVLTGVLWLLDTCM